MLFQFLFWRREFRRCTPRNVIHQKLARSAREVLTDYAIGTKSAQPGLMGGGGGHKSSLTPMQSKYEIYNSRLSISQPCAKIGCQRRDVQCTSSQQWNCPWLVVMNWVLQECTLQHFWCWCKWHNICNMEINKAALLNDNLLRVHHHQSP